MHLSADEKRIETVELHEQARITSHQGQRRRPAGDERRPDEPQLRRGRRVAAARARRRRRVDPDCGRGRQSRAARSWPPRSTSRSRRTASTPTALLGRENVQLRFRRSPAPPAARSAPPNLDAKGEPGKGLTRALFTGGVQYRERGADVDRAVNSGTLDVGLKPAMSSIDDAKFAQAVKFEEGKMAAQAAAAPLRHRQGHARAERQGAGHAGAARRQRADCGGRRHDRRDAGGPEAQGGGQRAQHAEAGVRQAGRIRQRREDAGDAQAGSAGAGHRRRTWTTTARARRAPTPAARA